MGVDNDRAYLYLDGNHIRDEGGDNYTMDYSDYAYSGWIIVESAPKPKMPDRLKKYKKDLEENLRLCEASSADCWENGKIEKEIIVRRIKMILGSLNPVLEEYAHE